MDLLEEIGDVEGDVCLPGIVAGLGATMRIVNGIAAIIGLDA